jgi:ElaB/YqjD/DUF883 family membrane-anchored ribosome-binding protein
MSRIDTGNSQDGGTTGLGDKAQQVSQDLRNLGAQVRETAKEKYDQYTSEARNYVAQGREAAQEWEHTLESYVQEKPLQALAMAAGVGLLLGLIWKRS